MEPVATNNATNFVQSGKIDNPQVTVTTNTKDHTSYTYSEDESKDIDDFDVSEIDMLQSQLGFLYYEHLLTTRKLEEIEAGMSQIISTLDNYK